MAIIEPGMESPIHKEVLTCVYCGQQYPRDTPTHGSPVLTAHIRTCEKHPLRAAEAQIAQLRKALLDLIGVETHDDLLRMQGVLATLADDPNSHVASRAIQALLDTETLSYTLP